MQPVWKKLQQMNLNTVIAPVYWELLEPVENKFNFSMVDSLIINARRYKLKLVLLWFGSWKNSMSCYVPAWIKTNTEKYPRVIDRQGTPQEILSPFSKSNEGADKKAFVQLIQHIKQTDNKQNTVIAIQVENEMGMLPNARGYEAGASAAFANNVPEKLMNYLQAHKTNLTPEIKTLWEENGFKTSGNWETVFGKSLLTDEIFTAWHLACYANEIAQSGKKIYGLPMYVNAALNRPNWLPGQYPGGGPLPHLKTIWDAAAPSIDILAPDIYFPDFKNWCDKYTQTTNPLFIPEIRFEKGDDAKAFFAFGNYNCLSFSPFSIESTGHPEEEPIGKAYHVLRQISHLITKYQPENNVKGALLSKDSFTSHFISGNYELTVSHEYTLGWSAGSKDSTWPLAGCLIIHVAPDEFYVAGTGVVVTFKSTNPAKKAGFISVDEGYFENKKWIPGRRMNGDEDHQGRHVRIPCNEYSTQHIQLYTY
jgi:Beta-galactosidase